MTSFIRPDKCCRCVSPKIGIQVLALLAIIYSIGRIISNVTEFTAGKYQNNTIVKDLDESLDCCTVIGQNQNGTNNQNHISPDGLCEDWWNYFNVLSMPGHIIHIIMSLLLILGVRQNKPSLMFPMLCMTFSAIVTAMSVIFTVFAIPSLSGGEAVGIFLILLLILILLIHWFLVIYWYYEDLRYQISEGLCGPKACSPSGNINNLNGPVRPVYVWRVEHCGQSQ